MSTSASYATVVQELYVAYFGRPADPAGLHNFEDALAADGAPTTLAGLSDAYGSNAGITALINAFGGSAESGRLYGSAVGSNAFVAEQFVTAVFENLFDRAPAQAGLQFWSEALLSGSMTTGEAAMEIALGAAPSDAATFASKIAAAATFTADLVTQNASLAYSGPVAAGEGRSYLAAINGSTSSAGDQSSATIAIDNMLGISTSTAPAITALTLAVAGDAIHLNGTVAASTLSLSGADLKAYPSASFGTLGQLGQQDIASINDTGGNFTLDASGNAHATTFNFGTGTVGGSDAASSLHINYNGVTTYVTSSHGDSVTLSAAAQNVTASGDGNVLNLGDLAYAGTLDLRAGTGGTDTINATAGGDLSGATILGTTGHAHINLVLSGTGVETLGMAEINLIESTNGSVSFAGGTFATNGIAFADAGAVTALAGVGTYLLSEDGNTLTVNNVADKVSGAQGGNDTVNLGALAYSGSIDFGTTGTDTIHAIVNGDLSGATFHSGGATVALELDLDGSETMSVAGYNLFNGSGGISFDATQGAAADTVVFAGAGTMSDNAHIGNYVLSSTGVDNITLNFDNEAVTANNAGDSIDLNVLAPGATVTFNAVGAGTIHALVGGDLSGSVFQAGDATLALALSADGSETMSVAQYNMFNAGGGISIDASQGASSDTVVFTDGGTMVDNANIGNYVLSSSDADTITLNHSNETLALNNADDQVTLAAAGETIDFNTGTFLGSIDFTVAGHYNFNVTAGSDIGDFQYILSGPSTDSFPVQLSITGSGTVRVNGFELQQFNAAGSPISVTGPTEMDVGFSLTDINLNARENALTTVGLLSTSNNVNISIGAASVDGGAAGFDQTVNEIGNFSIGKNSYSTYNIDNSSATIVGAADATHYVTLVNFQTSVDLVTLTLSGVAQTAGEMDISGAGNQSITVGNNSVILEANPSAIAGYTAFDATDLTSAAANMLRVVNAATATTGEYTFVLDTNQGAGIYETHINQATGSIDGIQLIGVLSGVAAQQLIGHVS